MHHRTLDSAKRNCNGLGYPGVGFAQVQEPPRYLPVSQYPPVPRCLPLPLGPPVGAQASTNQTHGMNGAQRVFPVVRGPYGYALVNQQPYMQGGIFPPQVGPSMARMNGWGVSGNMVGYFHAMVSRSRDFLAVLVLNWRLESLSVHATRRAILRWLALHCQHSRWLCWARDESSVIL